MYVYLSNKPLCKDDQNDKWRKKVVDLRDKLHRLRGHAHATPPHLDPSRDEGLGHLQVNGADRLVGNVPAQRRVLRGIVVVRMFAVAARSEQMPFENGRNLRDNPKLHVCGIKAETCVDDCLPLRERRFGGDDEGGAGGEALASREEM